MDEYYSQNKQMNTSTILTCLQANPGTGNEAGQTRCDRVWQRHLVERLLIKATWKRKRQLANTQSI